MKHLQAVVLQLQPPGASQADPTRLHGTIDFFDYSQLVLMTYDSWVQY